MLLIDAYNVLHAQWRLPPAKRGLDVPALVAWVERSRYAGRRVRVVCDGRPGPGWPRGGLLETAGGLTWTRAGRAEVVWSGPGREADDVIEEVLATSRGLSILVVSSDRRLARAAARAGADRVGNGTFLDQLAADDRARAGDGTPAFAADVPLDRYSVAHWMREFGFEPGDPAGRAAPPPAAAEPAAAGLPAGGGAGATGFGQRLEVALPERAPGADGEGAAGAGVEPREREPLDPLLAAAFAEWSERFDPADLDMERWIGGVTRLDGGRGR